MTKEQAIEKIDETVLVSNWYLTWDGTIKKLRRRNQREDFTALTLMSNAKGGYAGLGTKQLGWTKRPKNLKTYQ